MDPAAAADLLRSLQSQAADERGGCPALAALQVSSPCFLAHSEILQYFTGGFARILAKLPDLIVWPVPGLRQSWPGRLSLPGASRMLISWPA